MDIEVTLNGQPRHFAVEPRTTLLGLLRREGLVGAKHGCEDGSCGTCAVLIEGQIIHSCIMLAAQADGKRITTIESLGTREQPHPLQATFVETGAVQCGYCTPAMILASKALLDENSQPTEAEVRNALGGIICRCTGYVKPVEAVMRLVKRNGEVHNASAI